MLSDTHIPAAVDKLPPVVIEELKKSNLCLHAGDFTDIEVANQIRKFAELKAVYGNMDSNQVQSAFPIRQTLNIEGVTIGLTHGSGSAFGIMSRVEQLFDEPLDMYIFGHTHAVCNEIHGKKIFFNPGTPTDKFFAKFNSYGVLNINAGKIEHQIIRIE